MIGETISHFKIIDKLGQGGMGVVYRGVDLDLDRPVAIKVLPVEAQQNEDSIARFLREAKTASKLQHPAITTIYEFGVKDNLRYLVMEYIEGKTLKEMLKRGSFPIRQLLEITMQVVDALSLAGEKGIIHRDIKSENIMLTDRGQVKILDFGLAKILDKSGAVAHDHFQTAIGVVMGTITNMSPEQALGAEVDAQTDIYSTGVVMFEMVTGRLPFTGTSPSVVLAKILNQPPPAASDFNPEVPPSLEKVIRKCLDKNRELRYKSALNLLADLRAIKHEVESARDWSGTVVMSSGRAPAVESLRELIPQSPSPAPAASPVGGAAKTVAGTLRAVPVGQSGAMQAAVSGTMSASGAFAIPRAVRKAPSGAKRRVILAVAFLVKMIREAVGWAGGLYALGCVAVFVVTLFPEEKMRGLGRGLFWLHWAIDPALTAVGDFLPLKLTYQNHDFLPLGIAVGVYLLQLSATGGLERMEERIRKVLVVRSSVSAAAAVVLPQHRVAATAAASRMSLLREYAVAKRVLSEAQKEMAFLSVDVVGSTKMKLGEEKLTIEHAFAEYKKFLERIFRECRSYKMAWTPDGVMVCFPSAEDAVSAGRKIIADLDWFNRDTHQLRTKFHVRCGVNAGSVMIPEEKPLEEISDHTIDVAGHLQKEAEADTLWVSGEVYNNLMDRNGFTRLDTVVDGHEVYAWRKPV